MYFQVFTTNRETSKKAQYSCDTFQEVQDLMEVKRPKFMYIEYYDQDGLVGVAYKYLHFVNDHYITYKKIKS